MKIVAMIPTYNESGNIEDVVAEIRRLPLDIEVLVVDDLSPDGTYQIIEKMAAKDKNVHLLLRRERRGRGWAGIDGFKKALELGADCVIEMDGDHSHSPRFIPAFAARIVNADVVIGSRYVDGGKDEMRTRLRQMISGFARRYLSFVLGVRIADPTSGFRMFTRGALEKLLPHLNAQDPFIVTEILYYCKRLELKAVEVPIEFLPRGTGESKLKATTLIKYLFRVWQLKLTSKA